MTTTYYEIIDDAGEPATPRQRTLFGTPRYGYTHRLRAELACPAGCAVYERHSDGGADWGGRCVATRDTDGTLRRHIA